MRLANLDGRATLVSAPGAELDVASASNGAFGPELGAVYEQWEPFAAWAAPQQPTGRASGVRPGAPSPSPAQVFGIAVNYRAHSSESASELPAMPATFTKFPTCLTGDDAAVVLPSDQVDWEVELVVVIGVRADQVARADAWRHVAGLTIGQDLSERRVQYEAGRQFSLGKSYPGFGPMGPVLVTPDEFANPDDLALGCTVNGEVVQQARTSELVFDVADLVAELSAIVPLCPGDVIFTGTPAGVGMARTPPRFLAPGDVIVSTIEGIGTLTTRCVAPGT